MEGGIDDESAADVFPVRQSSEGGACSVAQAAVRPGLGASANGGRLTCYHHEMDGGKPRKIHSATNPSRLDQAKPFLTKELILPRQGGRS